MGNKIVKIIVLLCFCYVQNIASQEYKDFPYTKIYDIEYEEILQSNKEGSLDGKYCITSYASGNYWTIKMIEYKDGKKHGEWRFFDNPTHGLLGLNALINYCKGKKQGYYFFKNSNEILEGYYKDDKEEGLWTITTQKAKEKIMYVNGQKHGKYWKKDDNGTIIEGQYLKGNKEGEWKTTDPDLGVLSLKTYKNGTLIPQQ